LSFYFFCRVAFEKLNGAPIQMDLRAISPEDATAVSFGSRGQYRAYAFATTHRVPSQGYAIAAIRQGDRLIDRGTVVLCDMWLFSIGVVVADISIVDHVCDVMQVDYWTN